MGLDLLATGRDRPLQESPVFSPGLRRRPAATHRLLRGLLLLGLFSNHQRHQGEFRAGEGSDPGPRLSDLRHHGTHPVQGDCLGSESLIGVTDRVNGQTSSIQAALLQPNDRKGKLQEPSSTQTSRGTWALPLRRVIGVNILRRSRPLLSQGFTQMLM